jgi:hypothetical protein
MTQREQVFARAVVWRPSVLAAGAGGGLGWLIGIGSLAMGGVGPFIAAGPIVAALAGVARRPRSATTLPRRSARSYAPRRRSRPRQPSDPVLVPCVAHEVP